jgi:hypothetical protein
VPEVKFGDYKTATLPPAPVGDSQGIKLEALDYTNSQVSTQTTKPAQNDSGKAKPDSNSISNFPLAEHLYQVCQTDPIASVEYDSWKAHYNELTAMRMCLVTVKESGWKVDQLGGWNYDGSRDIGFYQINTPLHCPKVAAIVGHSLALDECRSSLSSDVTIGRSIAMQLYDTRGFSPWYGRAFKVNGVVQWYSDRLTL